MNGTDLSKNPMKNQALGEGPPNPLGKGLMR